MPVAWPSSFPFFFFFLLSFPAAFCLLVFEERKSRDCQKCPFVRYTS